ncbi:MAG: hypothetical protein QOD59_3144 [Mycobacterium sp.]|nr:hypothetical protein [Mycobacterium sp.]
MKAPGTPGRRAVDSYIEVGYTDQRTNHWNRLGGNRIRINRVQARSGSQGEPVVVASFAADEQQGALGRCDHCADPTSPQRGLKIRVEQDAQASSRNRLAAAADAQAGPDRAPGTVGGNQVSGGDPTRWHCRPAGADNGWRPHHVCGDGGLVLLDVDNCAAIEQLRTELGAALQQNGFHSVLVACVMCGGAQPVLAGQCER